MIIFVSDFFKEDYQGGAELTTSALIQECLLPCTKIRSSQLNIEIMKKYSNCFWVFANFANVSKQCLLFAIKELNYSVLEYDYKYCAYRSPKKHIFTSGDCNCENATQGKLVFLFLHHSKMTWWMSEKQKQIYMDKFSFLAEENNRVLSSVFNENHLKYIKSLDCENKTDQYIILDSSSWIKGREEAIKYAEENNLNYKLVWGLKYKQLLELLAESAGLIFFPQGGDTCPRLVIEAKLLGCKLITNDNVQHLSEPWFQTKESCYEYLEKRTKIFWNTLEEVWNLETPKFSKYPEETQFNIIIPFYNVEKWIQKCIDSVKFQNYSNYNCYLIDDMSTDLSHDVVSYLATGEKFKIIKNTEKRYALGNIVKTIQSIDPNPEAVNIILDGDDWFASRNTLDHLNKIYSDKDCFMTYGSYIYYPSSQRGVEPSAYPLNIIEDNKYRKDIWRASHLRSFKTHVWNKIDIEDLKDEDGFYKMAYDQAIMLPMLEMSRERAEYISEILYVYNRDNPNNVDKVKQQEQYKTAQNIRKKRSYERV